MLSNRWIGGALLLGAGWFAATVFAQPGGPPGGRGPSEGWEERSWDRQERPRWGGPEGGWHGGPPGGPPMGPPPAPEEIFDSIDSDGDGSISKEEFTEHHQQRHAGGFGPPPHPPRPGMDGPPGEGPGRMQGPPHPPGPPPHFGQQGVFDDRAHDGPPQGEWRERFGHHRGGPPGPPRSYPRERMRRPGPPGGPEAGVCPTCGRACESCGPKGQSPEKGSQDAPEESAPAATESSDAEEHNSEPEATEASTDFDTEDLGPPTVETEPAT